MERRRMLLLAKAKAKAERERGTQQQAPVETEREGGSPILPNASQIEGEGLIPSAKRVGMGVMDVLDMSKRAVGKLRGQDMSDPNNRGIFTPEIQVLDEWGQESNPVPEIDETNPARSLDNPWNRLGTDVGGKKAIAEAGKMLLEAGGDPIIIGGLMKSIVGKFGKGAVKATTGTRSVAGDLAGNLGQVPEKALVKLQTKAGHKELSDAWRQELPTAKEMSKKIFSASKELPESKAVKDMIKEFPEISMKESTEQLTNSIKNYPLKETNQSSVNSLKKLLKDFKSEGDNITAEKFKSLRENLDDIIDWNSPGAKKLNSELQQVRRSMKQSLLESAKKTGKTDYPTIMESWSNKLDKIGRLKKKLGNDPVKAEEKAFSLLNRLENTSGQPTKELVDEFDEVFKTDFSKKSEIMDLSRKAGMPDKDDFKVTILPKAQTGMKALAVVTGGFGWPRFSPKILTVLDKLESATKASTGFANKITKGFNTITKDARPPQAILTAIESLSDSDAEKVNKLLDAHGRAGKAKKKKIEAKVNGIIDGK
jgi:hypothetical protein